MKKIERIGIFDSGIGGLTVLKEVIRLPVKKIVYLADSKNVPYGNKSEEEIIELSLAAVQLLVDEGIDLLIIACYTVSSVAIDKIREKFSYLEILDVLTYSISATLHMTKGNVGVMGTVATINKHLHKIKLEALNKNIKIIEKPCPLLVSLIERSSKNLENVLYGCLDFFIKNNVDTIILGCTHYSIMDVVIKDILGDDIKIVSSKEVSNRILKDILIEKSYLIPKISYIDTGNCLKLHRELLLS